MQWYIPFLITKQSKPLSWDLNFDPGWMHPVRMHDGVQIINDCWMKIGVCILNIKFNIYLAG